MTQVFVTLRGRRYHQTAECSSFDDAERENGFAIRRWAETYATSRRR